MRNRLRMVWIVGAVSIAVLSRSAAVTASQPSVAEIVHNLQERYDRTSDFTADFRQSVEVPTLGRTLESTGRVYFKRPGRMRWEFLEPEKQTIVADGEMLWVYQPEQKQVLKTPFRAAFHSATPVSFLFGVGKLENDFSSTLLSMNDRVIRLRLDPRQDKEIGSLVLTVHRKDYDLRGADVTDPLGNVTRLRFSNLRRDVGLDDSRFRFAVPKGVDIVQSADLLGAEGSAAGE